MEPLVEIKNLSIRFPEGNSTFEAVKGISFSIGKGEIVGVVGESGSKNIPTRFPAACASV